MAGSQVSKGGAKESRLVQLAVRALQDALRRLRLERYDVDKAYAPTGETLFWLGSCDEGLQDLLGDRYRAARQGDPEGQLIAGIRWARNRMTHQRAIVIQRNHGSELGTWILGQGRLGTRDEMYWAPADGVPADPRYDRGRDVYEDQLAGQPVIPTAEATVRWIQKAASQVGLDSTP
ncbi:MULTISPECIES: hypothetical protein [Amycolatopsis]|uniref:hypothetical protein n=1 Tax=Amycolatopsis TaxID=1813 RepID=UPI000B8B3D2C|nr:MULTISPECIES: hypothetical protein [Amycolatopsis]OXM70795.1 hypothetical protein CF166_20940 [Amycolatopsis sp. KNN50.9b]